MTIEKRAFLPRFRKGRNVLFIAERFDPAYVNERKNPCQREAGTEFYIYVQQIIDPAKAARGKMTAENNKLTRPDGSQGGLQTMWATALDQDVTLAHPSITWCCDLAGTAKAKRLHGRWRIEYVPALDYYDPVFMAKRIKKAEVHILRAGLGDYTCPPSGLAISYLNLATPKKSIRWVQGSNHSFVPKKSDVVIWSTIKK